jgi:hypothetical protein
MREKSPGASPRTAIGGVAHLLLHPKLLRRLIRMRPVIRADVPFSGTYFQLEQDLSLPPAEVIVDPAARQWLAKMPMLAKTGPDIAAPGEPARTSVLLNGPREGGEVEVSIGRQVAGVLSAEDGSMVLDALAESGEAGAHLKARGYRTITPDGSVCLYLYQAKHSEGRHRRGSVG